MLALENPKPEAIAFQKLMIETNNILNQQARLKHDYFSKRVGIFLEDDVATPYVIALRVRRLKVL